MQPFAGLLATNPGLYKLVCALVFPVGLLMVVIGGAELYTGNAMTTLLAYLDKQASFSQMVKNLSLSWSGNLVGSLLMACAVVASGMLVGNQMPVMLAVAKTSVCLDKVSSGAASRKEGGRNASCISHSSAPLLPPLQILIRALLANFLVCVAVFNW
jgi:formate/nitrite transporter FocA (FNT family)